MSDKTTYIISPVTNFDADRLLWETYVGIKSEGTPLVYTAWGPTLEISRARADSLAGVLNAMEERKNKV